MRGKVGGHECHSREYGGHRGICDRIHRAHPEQERRYHAREHERDADTERNADGRQPQPMPENIFRTSPIWAPSAIRTPISRVRCAAA